jgi:hypothetical protein
MKLKEFIKKNDVTAYDVVDNIIINAVVGNTPYGLDVDTSGIPGGTLLVTVKDFTMEGDMLTVNDITVNVNDIDMIEYHTEHSDND